MNLAVGIPTATAPTTPVQRPAAKTSTGTDSRWQQASAHAMHATDEPADSPQAAAAKTSQGTAADKSAKSPTGRDARVRQAKAPAGKTAQGAGAGKSAKSPTDQDSRVHQAKASAGKTEPDRRHDLHRQAAASANAAVAAPYSLQANAIAAPQTGRAQAAGGAHASAERVTPATKNVRSIADTDAANGRSAQTAPGASAPSAGQAPASGSALQKVDPARSRATPVHPGAEHSAKEVQAEAGSSAANPASGHAGSLVSTAMTGTMDASSTVARARNDSDVKRALDTQAADPTVVIAHAGDGRLQKTVASLTATSAGSANYQVGAVGVAAAAPATGTGVVASSQASGQVAAGNNQNVLPQLGAQVHELYQGGGGQATVQLSPPSLGNVQIHVQMQPNHSIALSFVASQPQTAQLIQAGIPLLTQALQQNHIQLAQAQVTLAQTSTGTGTASGQQGSAAFHQQGGSANQSWHGGSLATQGRDAGSEPASADTQGVMAYA